MNKTETDSWIIENQLMVAREEEGFGGPGEKGKGIKKYKVVIPK